MTVADAGRSAQERYFASLGEAYASATQHGTESSLDLLIGGRGLRISFASSELADTLAPPLQRLVTATNPHLVGTIRAWDSASTDVPAPSFPSRAHDMRAAGAIDAYSGERFRCVHRDDGAGFHALSTFDRATRTGYFWFGDYRKIHWYERAEPLRAGIHWSLADEGCYLVHASAVGDERGAIVLTGRGGAGKTTTTLASVAAGLRFVGDNYVLVSQEEERTWVHGLYANAKLWPETLGRLPTLRPFIKRFDVAHDEKLVVDVEAYRPGCIASGLPIRAVVVSEVAGSGQTRFSRCSAVDALLALAPTTIFQLPQTDHPLAGMAEMVRRVPTYKLVLGADVRSGPRAVSELLDQLGS